MRLWIAYWQLLIVMEMVSFLLHVTSIIQSTFATEGKCAISEKNINPAWTFFCLTGHINMEEFIRGAQQDPWVLTMLKLDMNPAGWVLAQRRKSAYF